MTDYYVDWESKGKKRPIQHINGEEGVNILKEQLPKEWVVREYSQDYGIDLDVELFGELDNELFITKGEHILFQVKGTNEICKQKIQLFSKVNIEKENRKLETDTCKMEVIKYIVDTNLLAYVEKMGSAVPVLFCVVDIVNKNAYFVCLNDYIEKILIPQKPDYFCQKSVTINIPIRNCVNSDEGKYIIESYGKRAKLYAFFNKVHYQFHELNYSSKLEYEKLTDHF